MSEFNHQRTSFLCERQRELEKQSHNMPFLERQRELEKQTHSMPFLERQRELDKQSHAPAIAIPSSFFVQTHQHFCDHQDYYNHNNDHTQQNGDGGEEMECQYSGLHIQSHNRTMTARPEQMNNNYFDCHMHHYYNQV
jgi:hypothetical protein